MGCCSRASGWSKIGLLCAVCAFGLQAAGYVTNNWMVYNTVLDLNDLRVGLWWFTNCSAEISCFSVLTPDSYKSCKYEISHFLNESKVKEYNKHTEHQGKFKRVSTKKS